MSKFITPQDYDASIHREILDALTRNDNAIIEICEDRAISEMRGYLSTRYDADAIFKTEGAARNELVLMMAVDIDITCSVSTTLKKCRRYARIATIVQWNG